MAPEKTIYWVIRNIDTNKYCVLVSRFNQCFNYKWRGSLHKVAIFKSSDSALKTATILKNKYNENVECEALHIVHTHNILKVN